MAVVAITAFAGTGKLDYFEPYALERADMTGVKEGIDKILSRCEAEFAAAEQVAVKRSGRERDMVAMRIEIGRRLERYVRERHGGAKDVELMAWQGAEELRQLFTYFAVERRRDEARAKAPKPTVINVADFGAKGDGVTECGDAFRKAIAAAKAKNGTPTVVRIPEGVFVVDMDKTPLPETLEWRSYRDYDAAGKVVSRPSKRKSSQYGAEKFHLPIFGLENVTIEGSLGGTEIVFTDSRHGGFGFFGCTETMLKDVTIAYRDNPSTQGSVVSVDKDDVGFVFKRDPGYPDPDEERFLKAHSNRFTIHNGKSQLVDRRGTGRMGTVERLSADTFRFRPFANMKKDPTWNSVREGDRVIVIARYSEVSNGFPVNFLVSSFSGVENVTIHDAPGQNIMFSASYAMKMIDCKIRSRHGSDDLVTSNADGMMGSGPIGPYVDGCRLEHMEDDGFNIGTGGGQLKTITENRTRIDQCLSTPTAFLVDGVTGRIKSFLRRGEKWYSVSEPLCQEALSQADIDGGTLKEHKMSDWLRNNSWNGKKGERKADRILDIPGTVGSIIRNTSFYDLRGMGVQVHSANIILENLKVEHVTGPGANINPLFGWGMLFDVHNVLVRGCDFRDCSSGLQVRPGSVQPGVTVTQKMIQGIDIEDSHFELNSDRVAVNAANAQAVRIDGARFLLCVRKNPTNNCEWVESDFADRIAMYAYKDDTEVIHYFYDAPDAPVKKVVVKITKDPVDGAKRYRMAADISKGWFLDNARFPIYELPLVRGGDGADDCLILGMTKGGYITNPAAKPVGWRTGARSPGQSIAQFAASWDGDSGVYFGIEDTKGSLKDFGFDRDKSGLRFWHEELIWQEGRYEMQYPIVVRKVERVGEKLTWYDFADIYREWDRKQSWSKTTYQNRKDIPAWMKDAPVFTRFSRQWLERPQDIRRFVEWWKKEIGEMPVVAALWGWEKYGTWWGPDYFPCHPSDEVFTANMKYLGDNAFHPFAWPSGYNWCKVIGDKGDGTYEIDLRDSWIKPNEAHLAVNRNGSLFHQDAFWLRFGALTTLCGGLQWTHDWWNQLTKDIAKRGVDMVQVDQVVGGKIRECWSDRHGHPVGNGRWMWPAFRKQIETMRTAIKEVRKDGVVGVEEPCELFNDVVGIQDYRDLETWGDKFASIYSYIFHGYVPAFQSNPYRDEFYSLAHMAADGQMPFYRPDFAELEPTRPVLQNGGFENLIDSVRGPAGWDRLIPGRLLLNTSRKRPLWNFTGHNNMGWFGYYVTLDYDVKHSGAVSLKFDPPTKGGFDNGEPMQVSQTIENLAEGTYTVSAWVKCDDKTAPLGEIKYGTKDGGEAGRIAFTADSGWTKVSAEVKAKDHIRLIIWAPPGARFHIDDIRLERDGREVIVSGDSEYTRFMKKWIAIYRGEGRDFLADGFQIKPPAVECDRFLFAERDEPAVCVAAYESAKGEKAVVFANATAKPQKVSYRWKGKQMVDTIAPRDIVIVK